MKKVLKFIFGLIGIVLLLVLVLVIALVISLFNKNDVSPDYEDTSLNRSTEVVINTEIEKGLHSAKELDTASFTLDEEALEYLFLSITSSIDTSSIDGLDVTGVDVDVLDGSFFLYISGQYSKYHTVLSCGLAFEEDGGTFTIKLVGLKIGKLNAYTFRKIAAKFLKAEDIEKSLASKNIYCDIDFDNYTITFSKDNIKKMLVNVMGKDQEELVNVLSDIFLADNTILEFNLGTNNLLGAILHLNMIKYDESVNGVLPYHYDFDSLKNNTKTLLDNHIIRSEKVGVVYKYLVNGYGVYENDSKNREYIDNLDLTSIGITNNQTYKGIMEKPEDDSNKIVADDIKESLLISAEQMIVNKGFSITITDDTLTEALKTLDLIGFSTAFSNDFTNDVAYVVVEQLNLNCAANKITVDLIANINGEQIYIEVSLNTLPNNDGLSLTGTIEHIKIGSIDLSDNNKLSLLSYLKNVTDDINWITVNLTDSVETSTILFDFSQILNDNSTVLSFMSTMASLSLSVTTETKVVDGGIVITYKH